MKISYDFGDIKQDEREKTMLFLNTFFSNPVTVTNNVRKYNINDERMYFTTNGTIFSISFPKKITMKEEEKIFNLLRLKLNEGAKIKKTFSYSDCYPLIEEEFEYNGEKYFFACPKKENLIKDDSSQYIEDLSNLNIKLKIKFKLNELNKISKNIYEIKFQEAIGEQEVFFDNGFNFLCNIGDENISLHVKEKDKNMQGNENMNVKGEIYIGDIVLDLKTLSLLAPNDKIVFNKEDVVNAVLKIADNKIFEGHLKINDEKNILFVVDKRL